MGTALALLAEWQKIMLDKNSYFTHSIDIVPVDLFKLDRRRTDLECDIIALPVLPCHLGRKYLIIEQ